MSESWARRYDDLTPDAVRVLRAMALLDVVEVADLAAALAAGIPETDAAVEMLRQKGWVTASPDRLVDGARIWLANGVMGAAESGEATEIAGRLARYHAAALDTAQHDKAEVARWASQHRAGIVTAIRAAARAGLPRLAASVADTAWRVADRVHDPSWWRDLARHGEDAAIQGHDPTMLITLLNRSAVAFDNAGDLPTAEAQWVRALTLSHELDDHDRTVDVLTALVGLYRKWDRPEEALDALLELADMHQAAGKPIAMADAMAELGYTMLAAARPSSAEAYFSRADELLTQAPPKLVSATAHARVVEQWGRVLWGIGQTIRARRCFTRALDMVVNLDTAAADRLRALLATPVDAELPTDG